MKLIGSLTESQFRKELIASSLAWRNQARIIRLLEEHGMPVESMFSLNCTPGQLEDWHTVLVNGRHVVYLEVPKFSGSPRVPSVESTEAYARHLKGTTTRIQLAVALQLSKEPPRGADDPSSATVARVIDDV